MVERVEKPWGYELIYARTERYAGKILFIRQGERLSLQYHQLKDETIFVLEGRLLLEIEIDGQMARRHLEPGDAQHIATGLRHRMIGETDCRVAEVSSPELSDVVRLEDAYGRVPALALGFMLAAALAIAQSTTSTAPTADSESATTSGSGGSPPPAEKHRLGGGFRGLPVSAPASAPAAKPKPASTSPKPAAKARPVVITNETLGEGSAGGAGAPPPTPATALAPPETVPAITDLQGHDESWWRDRSRAARDRAQRSREALVALEAEEHRLETDFYAWDDGQYRDRVIKPEWDKAKQALADGKTEVAAAQGALDNLSEEARKAGALPGWLR